MGLLGRQFGLEREKEDLLLLTLSILTFTISLFSGYMENGIGRLIALPAFGIEFHLISTPLWLFSVSLVGFWVFLALHLAMLEQRMRSISVASVEHKVRSATSSVTSRSHSSLSHSFSLCSLFSHLMAVGTEVQPCEPTH